MIKDESPTRGKKSGQNSNSSANNEKYSSPELIDKAILRVDSHDSCSSISEASVS